MRGALVQLKVALEEPSFDPAESDRTFRVALSGFAALRLVAPLLDRLTKAAPKANLRVVGAFSHDAAEVLAQDVELAVGLFRSNPPSVCEARLWSENYCTAVRREHALADKNITLTQFTRARHVLVSPRGKRIGAIDRELEKIGRSRTVEVVVPDWTIAATLVARTDYLLSGPSSVIEMLAGVHDLSVAPLPSEIETHFDVHGVWPRRLDNDPAHAFLRDLVEKTAARTSG